MKKKLLLGLTVVLTILAVVFIAISIRKVYITNYANSLTNQELAQLYAEDYYGKNYSAIFIDGEKDEDKWYESDLLFSPRGNVAVIFYDSNGEEVDGFVDYKPLYREGIISELTNFR